MLQCASMGILSCHSLNTVCDSNRTESDLLLKNPKNLELCLGV